MAACFNNILVPVDMSVNTELAVKKSLELADKDTVIHLLHIQSFPVPFIKGPAKDYLIRIGNSGDCEEIERRLHQWKVTIEESKPVKVYIWNIAANSIQKTIVQKAKQLGADLIIIGKHSSHSWFPFLNTVNISQLVQHTGIPVLTAKPGSLHNQVKKIIVPVSARSVNDKMEIIATLCKKFTLRIYITTIMGNNNEPLGFYASSMLELYKWVRTTIGCQVEYVVLKGNNKAKAILNYAEKINADILLLYPETETKIGWMNTQICDVLPATTKVEVLTIQPLHSLIA